jgi:hypothetical protein
MKAIKLLVITLFALGLTAQTQAQTPAKHRILIDIAHGQRFWGDPATEKDPNKTERVKYLNTELSKTCALVNAEYTYQKGEIKPEHLKTCDLLFIPGPSTKFTPNEVKAITKYISGGGSLLIIMDEDYWATLEQVNVNDIIRPFDIQYGPNSPDTLSGGYTKAGVITPKPLKVTVHGARVVKGGTPFCFSNQSETYPFAAYTQLKNGGKIIAMGDGMTPLYMTTWKGVTDYQCQEFMHNAFQWLLKK